MQLCMTSADGKSRVMALQSGRLHSSTHQAEEGHECGQDKAGGGHTDGGGAHLAVVQLECAVVAEIEVHHDSGADHGDGSGRQGDLRAGADHSWRSWPAGGGGRRGGWRLRGRWRALPAHASYLQEAHEVKPGLHGACAVEGVAWTPVLGAARSVQARPGRAGTIQTKLQ